METMERTTWPTADEAAATMAGIPWQLGAMGSALPWEFAECPAGRVAAHGDGSIRLTEPDDDAVRGRGYRVPPQRFHDSFALDARDARDLRGASRRACEAAVRTGLGSAKGRLAAMIGLAMARALDGLVVDQDSGRVLADWNAMTGAPKMTVLAVDSKAGLMAAVDRAREMVHVRAGNRGAKTTLVAGRIMTRMAREVGVPCHDVGMHRVPTPRAEGQASRGIVDDHVGYVCPAGAGFWTLARGPSTWLSHGGIHDAYVEREDTLGGNARYEAESVMLAIPRRADCVVKIVMRGRD